jgi:hypothetical protein
MTDSYISWLRGQVGRRKILLVTASAVIRDAGGSILFQRRADFKEDWWGLPGGILEPGETISACIRRHNNGPIGFLRVHIIGINGMTTMMIIEKNLLGIDPQIFRSKFQTHIPNLFHFIALDFGRGDKRNFMDRVDQISNRLKIRKHISQPDFFVFV